MFKIFIFLVFLTIYSSQ